MAPRNQTAKSAPRGPRATHRIGLNGRADRDGDLAMGLAVKGRAGRVGKSPVPPNAGRDVSMRAPRRSLLSATAQREILKHAGNGGKNGDVSMKGPRVDGGAQREPVELKITGWNKSKASSDADGGVSSLLRWLEKKASTKLGSRVRSVKIKKSRVEGSELIISVAPEDVGALIRMNGYGWAGTNVTIVRLGGSARDTAGGSSYGPEDIKTMLRGVLERRYNSEDKFLDLSSLAQDEELKVKGFFNKGSTASKFFPAMMTVLELSFDTPEERHAAILSVSLANNDLPDLEKVTMLSQTLPKLQNLDLSNNKFEKLASLSAWRRRFGSLQHLILTNNPLEQTQPEYPAEILQWYPKLRLLNHVEVRTEEEVSKRAAVKTLPFPIRTAQFADQSGIAENFVRTLFVGFDTDRAALAAHYYDSKSEFSFSVNVQAPRDPNHTGPSERQDWENYIKNSRNLKRITQLPARKNRLFRGTEAVANAFATLPKTKHPDLASEARKWLIEAHMQPGVPDENGQIPGGVDGFLITVNGEFDEIDASGQAKKKRSFDRTFVIGAGGPAGVRVVSDLLTVRAYGGVQAFDPDLMESWQADPAPASSAPVETVAQLPPGLTLELAEQMTVELMKQTGMTLQYAKECLEQQSWNFDAALMTFAQVKASLPLEAFTTTA